MGLGLGFQLSGGRAVYAWPPALELAPGARLAWPLWVHPRVAGALDVSLAFCYEPAHAAPDGMKYRCACCEHRVFEGYEVFRVRVRLAWPLWVHLRVAGRAGGVARLLLRAHARCA